MTFLQSLSNWGTMGTTSKPDFLWMAERSEEWRGMTANAVGSQVPEEEEKVLLADLFENR